MRKSEKSERVKEAMMRVKKDIDSMRGTLAGVMQI